MWDLPGPGLEPVSPALADGFLTTVPPGKSHVCFLEVKMILCIILVYLVLFTMKRSVPSYVMRLDNIAIATIL